MKVVEAGECRFSVRLFWVLVSKIRRYNRISGHVW